MKSMNYLKVVFREGAGRELHCLQYFLYLSSMWESLGALPCSHLGASTRAFCGAGEVPWEGKGSAVCWGQGTARQSPSQVALQACGLVLHPIFTRAETKLRPWRWVMEELQAVEIPGAK